MAMARSATTALVGIFALSYFIPKPSWGGTIFRPDRTLFFEQCAQITTYSADDLVLKGRVRLSSDQREAIDALFDSWEHDGDSDKRKLAYILATAFRESRGTFLPIREAPTCPTDACRETVIRDLLTKRAVAESRPTPGPSIYASLQANGQRYYGRGYIQISGPENYKRISKLMNMGSTLYDEPDKVMEPEISRTILIRGMMLGWFGPPLSHYFNESNDDWISARRSVNPGSPHKKVTAEYGKEFDTCLHPP